MTSREIGTGDRGLGPGVRVGGRYVLQHILGCGATGTVWRAEGPLGAVAVKCLHPELAADQGVVDRFLAERAMLAGLAHPNLVAIRDVVAEPAVVALVLDLVEGPSVRERIEAGPVPPAEAAVIVAGVCRALAAAHAAGVVHRDVKPENVLLARNGEPRLTDFGVAYLMGGRRSTALGPPVGTAEYIAPELAAGATPTAAADVYAAGVLLFELLTGGPPFRAADPLAVLYRHVHAPPPFPMGAPPAIGALALRCLAKDPSVRPSAAEVANELAAVVDVAGAGTSAQVPTSTHGDSGGGRPTHPGRDRAAGAAFPTSGVPPRDRYRPGRARAGIACAAVLAGVLGTGVGAAVAGPPSRSGGDVRTGDAGPAEVYTAPTGWICTGWRTVAGRPGSSYRPCVLGADDAITGMAQTRAVPHAGAVAEPVDLELRWRRWTGTGWRSVAAGSCPVGVAAGEGRTCPAPGADGDPLALIVTPVDAQGAALGPGATTAAIVGGGG